jgi:hypothetical protein
LEHGTIPWALSELALSKNQEFASFTGMLALHGISTFSPDQLKTLETYIKNLETPSKVADGDVTGDVARPQKRRKLDRPEKPACQFPNLLEDGNGVVTGDGEKDLLLPSDIDELMEVCAPHSLCFFGHAPALSNPHVNLQKPFYISSCRTDMR